MVTTVRLDERREKMLKEIAQKLHRKKSEIIREAIDFYAEHVLVERRKRMESAVKKVGTADAREAAELEGTLDDGL